MTAGRHIRYVFLAVVLMLQQEVGQGEDFHVRVEDSFFEPPQLAINAGDTVFWSGFGAQDHTVTSDDNLFDEIVLFGEVFSYTFQEPGTYPYYCENHGTSGGGGMAGMIVVSAAG